MLLLQHSVPNESVRQVGTVEGTCANIVDLTPSHRQDSHASLHRVVLPRCRRDRWRHHQSCLRRPAGQTRLAEIDAPETNQPWGQRSKQALSELCFQKRAEIQPATTDRYGRTVARVICEDTDANLAQVRSGMAWVYTKYLKDPAVAAAETQAREARYGLWTDAESVPPWKWRHAAKQAHAK